MSGNDTTAFRLGELTAQVSTLEGCVGNLEGGQRRLWEANDTNNQTLARIEQRLEDNKTTALVRKVRAEVPTEQIVKPTKPWEKPVGEIMFDVLMTALKMTAVGAVVALISQGLTG